MFTVKLTPQELVALFTTLSVTRDPALEVLYDILRAELLRRAAQQKN